MSKDVNIHVKAPGAEETKRKMDHVAKGATGIGRKAHAGGKRGAEGMGQLGTATKKTEGLFSRLKSSIGGWVIGLVGVAAAIRAITTAIRIQARAIEEHATIATEQQKKLLALQAMGTFFEEHPEARKEVAAYAEFGRRPSEEVAEAWYSVESKGAGLTKAQKEGIMRESLELGRMEPESDLKSIVDMFSLYAKETRETDINLIQNVIRATMTKAGAELSEVGRYLPEFQPLGIAAGLSGAEAAGLWAYATTRTARPEKATVGLRNIFMALRGKGTPESQELLKQLGITPEMGFYEQMGRLSAQQEAGRFGVPEAETIAMKENAALLLSMLTEPQAMMQVIGEVSAAARPDIDITKEKLDQIMGEDEVARLEEEGRHLNIRIRNIKGRDIKALRWNVALKEYEIRMRKAGISETIITWQLAKYKMMAVVGAEPGPHELVDPYYSIDPDFPAFPTVQELEQPQPHEYESFPEEEFTPIQSQPQLEARFQPPAQIINYINDTSQHYYPRVGDDMRGPRVGRDLR